MSSGVERAHADHGTGVLVVEDDPQIRQLLSWALLEEGIAFEIAADGHEAIERLRARQPALLLLDMGLPLTDGVGVADQARASYGSALPIVVMTADGHAAEKAGRVGAAAYFHKPFDVEALLAVVLKVLCERL